VALPPYHRQMAMTTTYGAAEQSPTLEEYDGLKVAACLFHGFSDPHRIAILRHLALGEHRVVDLVAHLGLAQSTVSKHLACLKDCGLVVSRSQGRASVFSLAHPEALDELFRAGERLLDLTGEAVALCGTYGVAATESQ
jgi:DNA-binding transcriptional ArsR family regulator